MIRPIEDTPDRFRRLTRHLKIGMPGQRQPIVSMPAALVEQREKHTKKEKTT